MPEKFINWGLLRNPGNWLIVATMLAFSMLLITAIHASWTSGGK